MSQSPVFHRPSEDPEMDEAAAKARQTFRFFWREIAWERRRIVPGLSMAAVKASFSDPPAVREANPGALEVEYMWLTDVDFDGRTIYGTLINSPQTLQTYREGDEVKISGKQLWDWMYVCTGDVCGGFTVDAMRARMSASERKQHDDAWGLDFGPVSIVNVVPPSFLGQSTEKKKGLFSMFNKTPAPVPQDYVALTAMEHPMSVNMRSSLDDAIAQNPSYLNEADNRGMTFLHQLALAGSFDGVDVCLKRGANPKQPAKNGMTPLALAKCLGWTKVMQRVQQAGGV